MPRVTIINEKLNDCSGRTLLGTIDAKISIYQTRGKTLIMSVDSEHMLCLPGSWKEYRFKPTKDNIIDFGLSPLVKFGGLEVEK